MKIGILTHFHKSTNYGGVLQAYALCKYLNNQGYNAFQILYTAKISNLNENKNCNSVLKKVVTRIRRRVYRNKNAKIQLNRQLLFSNFRKRVPCSEKEYCKSNIKEAYKEADVFIVGSDQVWNPHWHDTSYMLDFAGNKPKIAYAASLGTDFLTEPVKEKMKKILFDFRAISVREKSAVDLISSIYKGNVETVVDPTLLLSVEDWNEISSERIVKKPYVFAYFLGEDKKARCIVEKYAEEKNLELVLIPHLLGEYRECDEKIKGKKLTEITPNDFISLIKYAEYIFTDSFHAVVFSLLYHKEFFAFERHKATSMSSRLYHLTDIFECADHFCDVPEKATFEYIRSIDAVDYSKPTPVYKQMRDSSYEFLRVNLENILD